MMVGSWWQQLALVMAGGALGTGLRFGLGSFLLRQFGAGFPWGTLAVNMAGSFAIGYLAIWLEGRGPSAAWLRAFLVIGLLGGMTTFSALMLECLLLARTQRTDLSVGYLAITLGAGLLLVWLGASLATRWGAAS